jgi:periplasmic divalent cation tolerance protein
LKVKDKCHSIYVVGPEIALPNSTSEIAYGAIAEVMTVLYGRPSMKRSSANCLIVFVTAGSLKEALTIGGVLVERRQAACANILPKVRSIYRWKGKVVKGQEVVLMLKTTDRQYQKLEQSIQAMHSYETPEIVAVPIKRGLHQYLGWVVEETTH